MGRAKKKGLDYFPVDVSLMENVGVRVLTSRYGAEGFYLYMYLMCRLHQGGYYLNISEDFISCAALDVRVDEGAVTEIIELMCKKGLFDEGLFSAHGILTSRAIQQTYLEVKCKRGRGTEVIGKYWLLDIASENLTLVSGDLSQTNDDLLQTNADLSQKKCINKTKENKTEENKTKENETEQNESEQPAASAAGACAEYAEIADEFNDICAALPKVLDITPPRITAIKSALKRLGREGLTELFRRTAASDFLTGKTGAWHASFDWILKPANLTKITEGNYDNKCAPPPVDDDYTWGGRIVNALALSPGADPDEYPF